MDLTLAPKRLKNEETPRWARRFVKWIAKR